MVLEDFSLDGKVAVVTGCNTGLGQGIAVGLAEAGADIVGVHRSDTADTEKMVKALSKKFLPVQADLQSVENTVTRIVEAALEAFGRIDILVNNAGIIRRGDSMDFSVENWDEVMNVNLKTVFFLSQAVARQFVAQETRGKIINIASLLSFQGGIRVPSYTASKHGIVGLTKILANDWASYGICVNAIAPGYMATNNTAPLRADPIRSKELLERIPVGRWGEPSDLKGAAVFLSSKASDYVTGYTLAVDGGWLSR